LDETARETGVAEGPAEGIASVSVRAKETQLSGSATTGKSGTGVAPKEEEAEGVADAEPETSGAGVATANVKFFGVSVRIADSIALASATRRRSPMSVVVRRSDEPPGRRSWSVTRN
jgi:hypothetical protein